MNLWEKITNKKKGRYVLSLDIGTEVVKALVSYIDYDGGKVINLGIGKSRQSSGNIVGGRILSERGVAQSCQIAIDEAVTKSGTSPNEVIIGFSGNTIKMFTSVFDVERKNQDSKIESYELKSIISSAHDNSILEINKNLSQREKQEGVRLISSDISDFVIDGYRIINPLNFKGGKIKVSVSSSFVLSSDFEMIEKIVGDLNLKLLKVSYGPYAVLKAIGGQDVFGFNAIMLDVGGNITDVVMVKNGNVQKAGMFVLGGRMFTKRIAHKFGLTEDQAEDLKIRYAKDQIDSKDSGLIAEILEQDIDLWFSGVELTLESYAEDYLLPAQILVFGGSSQLPGLVASLNKLRDKPFSFSGDLKLEFVFLEDVSDNINKAQGTNDLQDITLVCLAHLCFDGANEEDAPNKILEDIVLNK
jgi:cell division protein FtsA